MNYPESYNWVDERVCLLRLKCRLPNVEYYHNPTKKTRTKTGNGFFRIPKTGHETTSGSRSRILHSNSNPCTVEPLWCREHFLHHDKVVGGVHFCLGAILWICNESNTYVAKPVRPSSLDEEQGHWPCYDILRCLWRDIEGIWYFFLSSL